MAGKEILKTRSGLTKEASPKLLTQGGDPQRSVKIVNRNDPDDFEKHSRTIDLGKQNRKERIGSFKRSSDRIKRVGSIHLEKPASHGGSRITQ